MTKDEMERWMCHFRCIQSGGGAYPEAEREVMVDILADVIEGMIDRLPGDD
jgi:hypothetical protein